jgi:chromosome segregation protein
MEGTLQKLRQDVLTAENRINRARSRCTTLEVDLKTYQVKHASLTERAIELKEEVVILEQGLEEIKRLLEKRRAEQVASEGAVEKARSDSREILTQFRNLQEQIQEQDRGIARKTAQLNVLEGLQAKFEGFGEGAKAILGDKLNEVVSKGSVSIISKELTVDSIYTTALETLLGSAADALYIGDSAKALSVIGKLDNDFLGRACLQIDLAPATAGDVIDLPPGLVTAQSVVTTRNPDLQSPVERLLTACYFADSLDQFIEFWKSNPDFNFLLVATRSGEIIDCRGLIHGGRSTGKKSSSVLERESEIRRLRKEIEAERKGLNALREQANGLDERRNTAEATVEEQRKRQSELASEVSGLAGGRAQPDSEDRTQRP